MALGKPSTNLLLLWLTAIEFELDNGNPLVRSLPPFPVSWNKLHAKFMALIEWCKSQLQVCGWLL